MGYSVRVGAFAQGVMLAPGDTVEFTASGDTGTFNFAVISQVSLTGLNLSCEVQLSHEGPWFTRTFHHSQETGQGHDMTAATGLLSGLPDRYWCVHSGTVAKLRVRCTAIATGSCIVRINASEGHSQ